MALFKSKKAAQEVLLYCMYEIKDILNKDLNLLTIRQRSSKEWFNKFGKSVEHLATKRKLESLEHLKLNAESFILFNMNEDFSPSDPNMDETWIR